MILLPPANVTDMEAYRQRKLADAAAPRGHCQCGCGGKAPIAQQTDARRKLMKGEPHRYIKGHNQRRPTAAYYKPEDRGFATPCWVWTGRIKATGYAYIGREGKERLAHRWFYEMHKGPIPDGFQVDHLCRNTVCVNPDHLEAVTPAENNRRSESPTARNARKSHCKHGHPFDEANTAWSKHGRACRTCVRRRAKEAYWRRKRGERTSETTPQPVVVPLDPRAFCVAAIRRELAKDSDGPAAA